MSGRITLSEGDISLQEVDVIINAANSALVLGSGVAGAIRQRGGPSIQAECDAVGAIALGEVAVTGAGELPADHVIHAAVMDPGGPASEESVRKSLARSLVVACEKGWRTLACPALGAGVGGLPMQRCAEVLLEEARQHTSQEPSLSEIRFVLFGEPAYRIFEMVNDASKVAAQMARLKDLR